MVIWVDVVFLCFEADSYSEIYILIGKLILVHFMNIKILNKNNKISFFFSISKETKSFFKKYSRIFKDVFYLKYWIQQNI